MFTSSKKSKFVSGLLAVDKQSELSHLSDIFYSFLDKTLLKAEHGFLLKLWQEWPKLATTDILRQSKPVSFQKGRLVLWVQHSVQLMELSFQIEELKGQINRYFEKPLIQEIHFTVHKEILNKRQKTADLLQKIVTQRGIKCSE